MCRNYVDLFWPNDQQKSLKMSHKKTQNSSGWDTPLRFRRVSGREATLRDASRLWSPAEVTDGFPDRSRLTKVGHDGRHLQEKKTGSKSGKKPHISDHQEGKQTKTQTWLRRTRCCQSTHWLPDSAGWEDTPKGNRSMRIFFCSN